MDQRLEEAAYAGDLASLRRLLQEDRLLLHRQANVAAHLSDSPLHIAASLGHSDLVREILAVNPELVRDRNPEGLSALHLASAQGHLSAVKELLQSTAAVTSLCLAHDNDGFMPIHTAAIRGRIDVLRELLDACQESAKAITSQGDSILHLAVKSNSFETLQFLLNRADENDELLNLKDEKGNTILHLATARRQLQTVKLLLDRLGIEVNATNTKGYTVLDTLLDSPSQHRDLLLGELIRAAGGRTAAEEGKAKQSSSNDISATPTTIVSTRSRRNIWHRLWRLLKAVSLNDPKERCENKTGTLMVVATLIATITFQAALNPPGGFKQEDHSPSNDGTGVFSFSEGEAGTAVLGEKLWLFLFFDMVGLFASLSIILLLICCVPSHRKLVLGILRWIMWLAVCSTALAFSTAIIRIFPYSFSAAILILCWIELLSIFMVWVCFRLIRFLLRRGGCWKKKSKGGPNRGSPRKAVAVITKIIVTVLIIVLSVIVTVLISDNPLHIAASLEHSDLFNARMPI